MEGLEGFGREKGVVGSGWKREEKDWKGLEERREGLKGVGREKRRIGRGWKREEKDWKGLEEERGQ